MLEVGDTYVDTINLTDNSTPPVAVNSGTVVCTITLPDGTTATPTVSNPTTGTYTITYPIVQSGRHKVRWVGTVSNSFAQSGTFDAAGTDPGLIISLSEARASLRLPAGQTVDDEDLRSLVAASTPVMEDLCGPILARTCTETHDGGSTTVRLLQAPCISITTVTESYGTYTRTLTAQPAGGSTFDSYGYTVDLDDGMLYRRYSGTVGKFLGGRRDITVIYIAGRAVVGMNLVRANRRLVRFMWQQEMQGQRPNGSVPEGVSTTPSGYLVPNAVKALCGADLRSVGQG